MTILRIERAEKKIEKIDDFEILKQNNDIKYNTICRFCKNEIYLIKQKYSGCRRKDSGAPAPFRPELSVFHSSRSNGCDGTSSKADAPSPREKPPLSAPGSGIP